MKTSELYKRTIQELELKRDRELALAKEDLKVGYEFIQPINILKRTINQAAKSPEVQNDLFKIGLNLATGAIGKKVMGNSDSPIKKWLGTVVQSLLSQFVSKKSDDIQSATLKMIHKILHSMIDLKKSTSQEADTEHVTQAA